MTTVNLAATMVAPSIDYRALSPMLIVLGAAVIDDVLGLVILAVVSSLVQAGSVSLGQVGGIIAEAVIFLAGSIWIGRLIAPHSSRWLAQLDAGPSMLFAQVLAGLSGADAQQRAEAGRLALENRRAATAEQESGARTQLTGMEIAKAKRLGQLQAKFEASKDPEERKTLRDQAYQGRTRSRDDLSARGSGGGWSARTWR